MDERKTLPHTHAGVVSGVVSRVVIVRQGPAKVAQVGDVQREAAAATSKVRVARFGEFRVEE